MKDNDTYCRSSVLSRKGDKQGQTSKIAVHEVIVIKVSSSRNRTSAISLLSFPVPTPTLAFIRSTLRY